jgi:hypothetical protein
MSRQTEQTAELFTQLDISPGSATTSLLSDRDVMFEQVRLLREILNSQDRQNELLEELVNHLSGTHKQRMAELHSWKQSHPQLSRGCRTAAESLSKVQTAFIEHLAEEVNDQSEQLLDGEFMFNEFVDRYGPRLAHLNGVLQVLSQLGSNVGTTGPGQS